MKIATWNVNGIRARAQQFLDWLEAEKPDVVCLQELKATLDQVPIDICEQRDYYCYWHGGPKGYSGVGLLLRREKFPAAPVFEHPDFDFENRIVTARSGSVTMASVYVPNGSKDYPAKLRFLEALEGYAASTLAAGTGLVLCGDLNVTRSDMDVHPKERKPNAIGQLPEERALIERLLAHRLVDVGRAMDPDNDGLFTWWAPWRNMRQRNIGWRIDYILASESVFATCQQSCVQRLVGTSDHAPVLAEFALEPQLTQPEGAGSQPAATG